MLQFEVVFLQCLLNGIFCFLITVFFADFLQLPLENKNYFFQRHHLNWFNQTVSIADLQSQFVQWEQK